MLYYFVLHKPYDHLSQFTRENPDQLTLSDLHEFPSDVYPVGRLDQDSEGLLLLTNDKKLNQLLLDPEHRHKRTYWTQVEGIPTDAALKALRGGLDIRINKKTHRTLPAKVQLLHQDPPVGERIPPIRFRQNIPTSWLKIELVEGKNRQVRRMCAKVGFPVLRLIRISIEKLELGTMPIGAVKEYNGKEMYRLLNIKK
ncbi:MAG TPA: pseudouridine synthase [Saprospiraceae bacterium]|nr:pseudouridine synthase [Saprospiraceae bacterium]HMQ84883.1 pseudouridine synthase [Saprospiraceae bacterium]